MYEIDRHQNAPGAIGPYVQGYVVNGIVYTSGQIPASPADGSIPEGIAAQARQSCENVKAILEAAGSDLTRVIKTTCFLADMGDFAAFQRGLCRLLHRQTRPQLRRRQGPAQRRPL